MTIDYTRPPQSTPEAGQPRRSWWSRNWKWVVPVGCLTPLLLIGGCVAAIVMLVFGMIRSSDPYTDAVARAKSDPRVIQHLGEPIETGWWITGNVKIENDSGTADFALPLRGSRKNGILRVEASKDRGEWVYSLLTVSVDDGPVIDLTPPVDPSLQEPDDTTAPAG